MALKQSNHYLAISVAISVAILFVGSALLFAAHLILAADWSTLFSPFGLAVVSLGFIFCLLPALTIVWSLAFLLGLFWREPRLRAAAQGDSRFLKAVPDEPDPDLALRPGETLTLERTRSLWNILRLSVLAFFGALLVAASGEVIVFSLLPVFGNSTLNPFYFVLFDVTPPPPPSALDWFTAVYPLALGALLLALIPYLFVDQHYTLMADDQGLTIRRRGRRRFIPWTDMVLFIQSGGTRSGNVTKSYLLWGYEQRANFEIVRSPIVAVPQNKSRVSRVDKLDTYRFAGGFERYAADAQRLLATIAARGHCQLQTFASQPAAVSKIERRFPHLLKLDDLTSAPLAGKEWQPAAQEASEAASSEITLKERLPIRRILLESVIWLIGIGVFFFACYWTTFQATLASELSGFWPPVVVGIVALFAAVMAFLAAGSRQEGRRPAIIGGPNGLTRKTNQKSTTITLAWDEMRAWAILTLPGNQPIQRTYVVCSERATLTWTERANTELAGRRIQGDRRLVYQERAEQLHRLIAARTGLPLHDLSNRL